MAEEAIRWRARPLLLNTIQGVVLRPQGDLLISQEQWLADTITNHMFSRSKGELIHKLFPMEHNNILKEHFWVPSFSLFSPFIGFFFFLFINDLSLLLTLSD